MLHRMSSAAIGRVEEHSRRLSILLTLAVLPLGCMKWVERSAPIASLPRGERVLRITHSGGVQTMFDPFVSGDSLVGWKSRRGQTDEMRIAVALEDVKTVARQRVNVWRTALLALGILTIVDVRTSDAFEW